MKSDNLEFRISQYLDGTLSFEEVSEIERLIAEGGEARALLEQYQKLDLALKAMPLPEIRWEALAVHLSQTVANHVEAATGQGNEEPVRNYAMPWVRSAAARWAVAASVVIATGLGIFAYHERNAGHDVASGPVPMVVKPIVVAVIHGPEAEVAAGKPTDDIEIGPPTGAVAEGQVDWQGWRSSQAIVTGASRVVIASGAATAQDTGGQSPY